MAAKLASKRLTIPVKARQSALQEAARLGDEAGSSDSRVRYRPRHGAPIPEKFEDFYAASIASIRLRKRFREFYKPQLQEVARSQARLYAILLTKVSDRAAARLYRNAPGENIKNVTNEELEDFVDEVVRPEIFLDCILTPVMQEFWRAWRESGELHTRWRGYRQLEKRKRLLGKPRKKRKVAAS